MLEVLELVFSHLSEDDRRARTKAAVELFHSDRLDGTGVFGLWNVQGRLLGGFLAQVRPDGTVLAWPPVVVPEIAGSLRQSPVLRRLYTVGIEYCDSRPCILMADPQQRPDEEILAEFAFEPLSDLLYLIFTDMHNEDPTAPPRERSLQFRAMRDESGEEMDALTAVTARTYENTLDFPRLARLGSVTDILEGYKADHVFRPDLWFFVHELPDRGGTSRDTAERGQDTAGGNSPTASDEPVGVLLLTSIPGRAELELTYLGLVEPARGRGHAMEMIAFARQIARREGAAFLLTSADARNIPAVKSYLRSGFRLIDRKTLYFRQG